MSDPLRPRRIAAAVLGRVVREGAYSNVLLGTETSDLEPSEAARVKGLVYGSLRTLPDLDRQLAAGSKHPIDSFEGQILDILRLAAFEIRYSHVPDPVAVSVGVDLVREVRPKASGLANAILRRVAESRTGVNPALDLPDWLRFSLSRQWGNEMIDSFAEFSSLEAPRVARYHGSPSGSARPVPEVEGAYELAPGAVPEGFHIQDTASIAVGNTVRAEPGMRVLDVAAAPGGKTAHLIDQVGPSGIVVATDSHIRRTRSGHRRVPGALWITSDGRKPPLASGRFDRILIDAPCSGLGTLRRRPEIIYRVGPDDVAELASLQRELIEASLPLLAPGGELVFSVCTVTPEETADVVTGLGFEDPGGAGETWGDGRLMAPQTTGTDGMFIARYRD